MLSIFDLEKLQGLLRDFYTLSHIRITVFDETRTELISYPEEVAPYCGVIRSCMQGYDACMACDRAGCAEAARRRSTYLYRCHAGLTEAVAPLYVGDVLAGYLLFGHGFAYPSHEEGWQVLRGHCAELPLSMEQLREAAFKAELIGEEQVRAAAHILHAVASFLILEQMASLREDLLAVRLDAYLTAHYTEKLRAPAVASQLGIGKTQLYALSRQLYGCGIARRIRTLRLEEAKRLLKNGSGLPLAEVAARCGFSDYNYFITVFTREVGCSPGLWQRGEG